MREAKVAYVCAVIFVAIYIIFTTSPFRRLSPVIWYIRNKLRNVTFNDIGNNELLLPGIPVEQRLWENLTLHDPPLTDWQQASSSQMSVMTLVDDKRIVRVGDNVIVNITVKDFLGRRKNKGGDVVQVVAKDSIHYSLGYVFDQGGGTYTGVVKMLWSGNVTLELRIGPNREMLRVMFRLLNSGVAINYIGKTNWNERVKCTPMVEFAQGFKQMCNHTHYNADLPWFCEKPSNGKCETFLRYQHQHPNLEVSKEEALLLDQSESRRVIQTLTVKVSNSTDGKERLWDDTTLDPCNKYPPRATWTLRSPIGGVYSGVWYPLHCRATFDNTPDSFEKCLAGKKIWFIGDSNQRELFTYIFKTLSMHLLTEKWTMPTWHNFSIAENTEKTVTMYFSFHAMPTEINPSGRINGTHDFINRIPTGATDIVVVHFYLHFLRYPPSLIRQHIRKTAEAVMELHKRAPKVKVIVRGCHSLFPQGEKISTGVNALVYNRIIKEEFKHVSDFVYYLDTWDVTLGNGSRHPPDTMLKRIMMYLMSFICP